MNEIEVEKYIESVKTFTNDELNEFIHNYEIQIKSIEQRINLMKLVLKEHKKQQIQHHPV